MKSLDAISNLKIRASYGKSGNQDISSYRSLASLGTMNYAFGGSLNSGVGPTNIPNPDLKWKRQQQRILDLILVCLIIGCRLFLIIIIKKLPIYFGILVHQVPVDLLLFLKIL
jgi:hypothetical protein